MKGKESNLTVVSKKTVQGACPVCGIVSYSRGGIHPQCASQQADAPRVERLKAAKKVEKVKVKTPKPRALGNWQKRCPKCGVAAHVRTLTCGCGHSFSK